MSKEKIKVKNKEVLFTVEGGKTIDQLSLEELSDLATEDTNKGLGSGEVTKDYEPHSKWPYHTREDLIDIIEAREIRLEELRELEFDRTLFITGVKHLSNVVVALTLAGYSLNIGLDLETTRNGEDNYGFIVTYVLPRFENLRFIIDEF